MEDSSNAYRESVNTTKAVEPNSWVQEKKRSSAEVDLVLQFKNLVFPIEIKSGKEGTLKSLHQFIETDDHYYAIRIYANEFRIDKHTMRSGKEYILMNLPYHLGTKLNEYVKYFVSPIRRKLNRLWI